MVEEAIVATAHKQAVLTALNAELRRHGRTTAIPYAPPYELAGDVESDAFSVTLKPQPPYLRFEAKGLVSETASGCAITWLVAPQKRTLAYMAIGFSFLLLWFAVILFWIVSEGKWRHTPLLFFAVFLVVIHCFFYYRYRQMFLQRLRSWLTEACKSASDMADSSQPQGASDSSAIAPIP